ncbi:MAG: hypothetical protein JW862_13740, partial [Anaerolineales bacterium]|nr:hypothetical protein [Anaerolineales bacterium]
MLKHGFHYLPGTHSYRQFDLDNWLPRLALLKARWLVIQAPINRAIPEYFLTRLLSRQIEPVIHFANLPIGGRLLDDLQPLFEVYARWGIRYLCIYDRPNLQKNWPAQNWGQANLVETFLDQYLPVANASLQAGLTPIFPPLEPGGDYWDTAFLQAALQGLRRRRALPLLKKMMLGAYAYYQSQDLNWGAGGPERWPLVRPYSDNLATQDQRGFRIFDWYLAIARATLGKSMPIFLFGMGAHPACPASQPEQARLNLQIVQLLAGQTVDDCEGLPGEVIAGVFSQPLANENQPGEIPAVLSELAN